MSYGLSQDAIRQIQEVFARYVEVDQAILYGSRAKGDYKVGSDIDVCLKGEGVDFQLLSRLSEALYALPIPYTVDLSIFSKITNPDLLDHIHRVGIQFYNRDSKKPIN